MVECCSFGLSVALPYIIFVYTSILEIFEFPLCQALKKSKILPSFKYGDNKYIDTKYIGIWWDNLISQDSGLQLT